MNTNKKRLDGQIAIVTGASRGLGKHIAARLASEGAHVAVNYLNSAVGAAATVAEIRASGGNAHEFQADVACEAQVLDLIDRVRAQFGAEVDIVVNNATGPQPMIRIEDCSWADYLAQLELFVKAPFLLVQAVLPSMRARGGGCVVNIGSEVVQLGRAPFATYVSAKAAMIGLTRSWANELAPSNIRVNLVAPGWIPVERHANADTSEYQAMIPLGHMGDPADVANAVLYLSSSESQFVTGQCLGVNGGRSYSS